MDPSIWPVSFAGPFQDPLDDAAALFWCHPSSIATSMPASRPVPASPSDGQRNAFSTIAADASTGSDRTRGAGVGPSVLPSLPPLPPLPQDRSPLAWSSSPRHHSSTNASTTTSTAAANAPSSINPGNAHYTPPRGRRSSPSYWQTPAFGSDADLPLEWGDDTLLDDFSAVAALGAASDFPNSDDQYLAAFAEHDFSSPSTYPSFLEGLDPSGARGRRHQGSTAAQAPGQASAPTTTVAAPHQPAGASDLNLAAPSRTTTQLTNSSLGDSQNANFPDDLFGDDASPDTPLSSFSDAMPPVLRGRSNTATAPQRDGASGAARNKRRRTSRTDAPPHSRRSVAISPKPVVVKDLEDEDDLFGETPEKRASNMDVKSEDYTTIDLTEANEVPEDLSKPDEDNRTKMSAFQCVICMDDVTTLTVTHCGHLFCAQCLHQSLHVEATRGKCPMCRSKVDMKSREAYSSKTKGFWPLELKLMTATRKGKRKADTMSS